MNTSRASGRARAARFLTARSSPSSWSERGSRDRLSQRTATRRAAKQGAVSRLVQIYANRGHLIANLDPLGLQKRPRPRVLELGYFGLTEADLDTEFLTGCRPASCPRS